MDDDDLAKRVAQLKDEKQVKETDQELKQRFDKIFSSQPNKYAIPDDADMDEVDKLLQESGLLSDLSDDNDDDDNRVQDERFQAVQKAFLGDDPGLDDESNELLQQVKDQVSVERKYASLDKQRDKDLEERFDALKKTHLKWSSPSPTSSPSSNSNLPGPPPKPIQADEFHDEMDDWCCMCNDDGTIECVGCEEKYCNPCFHESHQSDMADYEATKHKWHRVSKTK
ncbi:hypothetical protein BJV82DRAFT_631156 [Fennellomyces sp. T-0311]|nr:hypothetical protein BJV82DRAFT_631156 [Fennellomyces sp. T-0311]